MLNTRKLRFDLNVWSLISKNVTPTIDYIGLEDGSINILVLSNGLTNYQITSADSTLQEGETPPFHLYINKYELINTDIKYVDQTIPLYFSIKRLTIRVQEILPVINLIWIPKQKATALVSDTMVQII